MKVELQSTITCPACRHQATETMPTDACQYMYDCKRCGAQMKPKKGDCCVFARTARCRVLRSRSSVCSSTCDRFWPFSSVCRDANGSHMRIGERRGTTPAGSASVVRVVGLDTEKLRA
jgi:hypothetical protein